MLIATFMLLWLAILWAFFWVVLWICSRVPYMGKRHRHAHWNELNKIDTLVNDARRHWGV